MFNEKGEFTADVISATTFNDLYKWTMMPVIRKLEETKGQIVVTFGIDLRDDQMVKLINSDTQNGMKLRRMIAASLNDLQKRIFRKEVFKKVNSLYPSQLLSDADIEAICGSNTSPQSLIDQFIFADSLLTPNGQEPGSVKKFQTDIMSDALNNNKVIVSFYSTTIQGETQWFIEATGPWHRVTWLETSMMQCVYETKLRYDIEEKRSDYYTWLFEALLRCAKSICYTKSINNLKNNKRISAALFTGRRTGGLLFLLLQNLMFADNFNMRNEQPFGTPVPLPECLGTSSCDSWVILNNLGLKCLRPVGTHAHEMSMVTSILFYNIDSVSGGIPFTQVICHYLYKKLVNSKTGGPMPMLPDTLGTRAFMKAALSVIMENDKLFLSEITSARQDSGKLEDFLKNMDEFKFTGSVMASEIDTVATLYEAFDYVTILLELVDFSVIVQKYGMILKLAVTVWQLKL